MSLSEDVINCIGNYMEWPLDAVSIVVDLRSEEIKIYKIFFRPWYQKPLQEGKSEKPILRKIITTVERFQKSGATIFYLYNDTYEPNSEIIDELSNTDWEYIEAGSDGLFYNIDGELNIEPKEFNDSNTTVIRLKSNRTEDLPMVNLPIEFGIELFGSSIDFHVNVKSQLVQYNTEHDGNFRIQNQDIQKLMIDIQPSLRKDKLVVKGFLEDGTEVRIQKIREMEEIVGEKINHLGIIFDCTCPDSEQWSQTLNTIRRSGDGDRDILNKEIRNALSKELKNHFDLDVRVSNWLVNDMDGKGISPWDNLLVRPQITYTKESHIDLLEVDNIYKNAQWLPGYDIWDPIGEALLDAVESLQNENAGIIIIGNSPPYPYSEEDTLLVNVHNELQIRTSVRNFSTAFKDAIQLAEQRQIPVVYLFLTHYQVTDHNASFSALSNRIQSTISETLRSSYPFLNVIKEQADSKGIAQGIVRAKDSLKKVSSSSFIRILREG